MIWTKTGFSCRQIVNIIGRKTDKFHFTSHKVEIQVKSYKLGDTSNILLVASHTVGIQVGKYYWKFQVTSCNLQVPKRQVEQFKLKVTNWKLQKYSLQVQSYKLRETNHKLQVWRNNHKLQVKRYKSQVTSVKKQSQVTSVKTQLQGYKLRYINHNLQVRKYNYRVTS